MTTGAHRVRLRGARRSTACLAVVFALAAVSTSPVQAEPSRPLTIAVPAPLSGSRAAIGLSIHTAIGITIAELNAAARAGDAPVAVKLFDDPCITGSSDAIVRDIATNAAIDIVIGHPCGPSARAGTALYKAAGKRFMAVGTPPVSPPPGDLRLPSSRPLSDALAAALVVAATERAGAKFAIVRDRTQLNTAMASAIDPVLRAAGHVVTTETFSGGDRDFAPLARKLVASGITHVALLAFPVEAAFVARALVQVAPDIVMIGPEQLGTPDLAQIAGIDVAARVSIVLPTTLADYERTSPAAAALVTRLRAVGVTPTREAIEAVAGLQAWVGQMRTSTPTSTDQRTALTVPTVIGPLAFDRFGDATRPFWIKHTWRDGKLVPE